MGVCGAVTVALGFSHLFWRLPGTAGIGRDIVPLAGSVLDHRENEDEGVLILIGYRIAPEDRAEFIALMAHVEQSRLRTGARSWTLYRDSADPERLVEAYSVGSWREHLSQHEVRTTQYDGGLLDRARGLSREEPTVQHLVMTQVRARHSRHPSSADVAPPS